jgi:hypothetical protein
VVKRVLLIGSVLLLAFPAAASARFFLGPFQPQVNNDGVEISVTFKNGAPKAVTKIEFHNVPTGTPCNGSNFYFRDMQVDPKTEKFHGSGHPGEAGNADWPPFPNMTTTWHGRFFADDTKIHGTLEITGKGGCNGDTGKLTFLAHLRTRIHHH